MTRAALLTSLAEIYLAPRMRLPTPVRLAPERLRRFEGRYEFEPGDEAEIRLEGDRLVVHEPGLLPVRLVPESEVKFLVEGAKDDRYFFSTDTEDKVLGFRRRLSIGGNTPLAFATARKVGR